MSVDEERLENLEKKLDILIRLLGMTVGTGMPTAERAPMLARTGMDRIAIAAVCDASVEAISVRLSEAKRKTPSKKRKA